MAQLHFITRVYVDPGQWRRCMPVAAINPWISRGARGNVLSLAGHLERGQGWRGGRSRRVFSSSNSSRTRGREVVVGGDRSDTSRTKRWILFVRRQASRMSLASEWYIVGGLVRRRGVKGGRQRSVRCLQAGTSCFACYRVECCLLCMYCAVQTQITVIQRQDDGSHVCGERVMTHENANMYMCTCSTVAQRRRYPSTHS